MSEDILRRLKIVDRQLKELKETHVKICDKLRSLHAEKETLEAQYKVLKLKNQTDISEWSEKKFPWSNQIDQTLKEVFKFTEFRSKQQAAINATLSRKDVLLLMPTGGGKSLVYQLPALINKHLTLVVSPLLSLIEDQLIALEKLNIEAASLNGSVPRTEKKRIHNLMIDASTTLRLLYVTPEWVAKSKIFMSYLQKCFDRGLLDRIVIDEVHCCSTWGHDFRPDYNYLGFFKSMFPGVPILGLTATATMSVLVDIQKMLCLADSLIITAPFNRPNLFYKLVAKPPEKSDCLKYIADLLSNKYKDQSGIIYSATVKDCEDLAEGLRTEGLKVKHYHAQVEPENKKIIHQKWLENKYQAVVATVAFGMGIDKPDVRFVIHHAIPRSMEALYQESGRAGRDGKNSDCILMYGLSDFLRNVSTASSKTEEKNNFAILSYCCNPDKCRRSLIATHFEDSTWHPDHCQQMCDICKTPKNISYYNVAPACRELRVLIAAANMKEVKMTLLKLTSAWFSIGAKELRVEAVDKPLFTKEEAEYIIGFLILGGYLKIEKGFTLYNTLAYIQAGEDPKDEKILMPYCSKLEGLTRVHPEDIVKVEVDEVYDSDEESGDPPFKKPKF